LERRVSSVLVRFPRVRYALKTIYQRANYLLHREAGFSYWLADGVRLHTPAHLAGLPEPGPADAEFFGYFDASPWSPDSRYYVVHHVTRGNPDAAIVLYDFKNGTRSRIGTSPTWTWQQGALCRWTALQGSPYIAFNTLRNGLLGTQIVSPEGHTATFLPYPLQAINDKQGLIYSINYRRLAANGTDYGYRVSAKNFPPNLPHENDGIWVVRIGSGEARLTISLASLVQNQPRPEAAHSAHEINHISIAPGGERFVFVHRYRGHKGQFTRLYVARSDGTHPTLLLDDDMVSHYTWITDRSLIAWARKSGHGDRYYLIDVDTREANPLPTNAADQWGDGHPTYHGSSNRIITDSYADRRRQQHLFEFDATSPAPKPLAKFHLPLKFHGSNRIDLHPRWRPDGCAISVDAGHTGVRRNYILEIPDQHDSTAISL
jgi:hypothetical protein